MIIFPNCKINLGLRITGRRPDGYHNIESIFYPLPLFDALELVELPAGNSNQLQATGLPIDGKPGSNLCLKAYQLLKREFPLLPPVRIHLHKVIPVGAGLGGGSTDAAFMLMLLNNRFELGLSEEQLATLALELGSDCPFFIYNKVAYGTARGEQLEPVSLNLQAYKFVVVNPGIHISTAEAFSFIRPQQPDRSLKEIIQLPIGDWQANLVNDFEKEIFGRYPQVKGIHDTLISAGALYASMSGTGSTVYGIFDRSDTIKLSFPGGYFVRELSSQLK